jgi:hypothetical protein
MLKRRRRGVATKRELHLLQLRLAGERAQCVLGAIERQCHSQPALENEDDRFTVTFVPLPRLDASNPVGGVDDAVTDGETQCFLGVVG